MALLYLIRHAATADTGNRLTGRLPGVGLNAAGREEAAAAAESLAAAAFGAIYTSPLRRCRETARAIAAHQNVEPIPYRSLIEVDYGTLSGRTFKSLQRTRVYRSLMAAPVVIEPASVSIINLPPDAQPKVHTVNRMAR